MAETVASGRVEITGDDSGLQRTLAAAEAEFKRTMDRIDRQHATANVDIDTKAAEAKLKELEAKLKRFDQRRADQNLTVGQRKYAAAQAKALNDQIAAQKKVVAGKQAELAATKAQNTEAKRSQDILAATMKREKTRDAALAAYERRRAQAARREEIDNRRAAALAERDARRQETIRTKAERDRARAQAQIDKEIASLPRLARQYAELDTKIERLTRSRSKMRGEEQIKVDLRINEALSEFERLKGILGRHNAIPPLKLDVAPGRDMGLRVRQAFLQNHTLTGVISGVGADLGRQMGDGLQRGLRRRLDRGLAGTIADVGGGLGAALGRGLGKFGHMLEGLSEATVRIGPFTASIRTAVAGLSILGPVIVDIVGALGALVGVAGSAALGVGALGLGASGLLLSFGGIGLLMKPMLSDFKTLTQLSTAAHKAVLKYGAGSDQAKTATKQLNEALKNTNPSTRQAIQSWGQIVDSWSHFVDQARPDFADDMAAGLKTVNANIDTFGSRSVQAFHAASTGWQNWMAGLRTSEATGILDTIMGNANAAIQPLMSGLGNLATYLGRVAAIASGSIPGLARTFERWTDSIKGTSEAGQGLSERVHNVIQNAKDVGRFFLAAGRLVKSFFGGGVQAGAEFVNTMTAALTRWTAFLNTGAGQDKLHSFFSQSVSGVQALYSVLGPVVASFTQWAMALAPLARAFFSVGGYIASFVTSILRLTALRGPLTAIATTLGTMWAIGKISAATRAVSGFTAALFGLGRAQAAMATAGKVGGVAGAAGAARGVGGITPVVVSTAEKAAPALGKAARAGALFRNVFTGIGAAVGFANPIVGAAVIGIGALAFALTRMHSSSGEVKKDFAEMGKTADSAAAAYRQNAATLPDVASEHQRAAISVREARKALEGTKKGTDEYKTALLNLNDAQRHLTNSSNDYRGLRQKMQGDADKQVSTTRKQLADLDTLQAKQRKGLETMRATTTSEQEKHQIDNVLAAMDAKRAPLIDRVNAALNRQAAVSLNTQRATAGMLPLLGQAEQKLGALARRSKSTAVKIALKFSDAGDASRVAASASKTLKSGVPNRIVTRIVADSSNADQAVKRLQGARITAKKLQIIESGGKNAISTLQRITGHKLTAKQQRIVESGGSAALGMLARLIGVKLPGKTQGVRESGSAAVLAVLARILGIRIPEKKTTISGDASGALAAAAAARAAIASVPSSKTSTITTVYHTVGSPGSGKAAPQTNRRGLATGRAAGGRELALTGEGGGPEIIANAATGATRVVREPTFMNLDPGDFVIPTEPKYRSRGRDLFDEFAKRAGIPGFAKGKAPKSLTAGQKATQRRAAKKRLPSASHYASENIAELPAVERAKRAEENQARQISINEGQLKEPASFLRVVGQDAEGNPLYDIDQGTINNWAAALNGIASQYDQLDRLITETEKAVSRAITRIGDATQDNAGSGGIIGRTNQNMNKIRALIAHEDKIINGKKVSTQERQAARERQGVYRTALTGEKTAHDNAFTDWKSLDDERNDIGFRHQDARNNAAEYRADAAAVQGTAEANKVTENPKAIAPDKPASPIENAQQSLANLDAETALAAIGQGMGGAAPRSTADINADIVKFNQSIIDLAKADLADSDPSNDSAATSALTSAANAINAIQQNTIATAGQIYSDNMNLGTARHDLFSSMGSNFSMAAAIGATSSAFSGGGGSFGGNSANFPTTGSGTVTGMASGGGGIVFQQTFNQMPDPHSWSQGVAFELQAAL